ncbi:hypothetical protein ON010_g3119 [Phytophthora cinnamomi]|nr:hypothetical protein ON010_g3119 [Phytophthora cinnamomi]
MDKSYSRKPAMLYGMGKLMLCDALLIFIYPPYYHIFTTLSAEAQTAFTILLPLIKLIMRNLFARAARHLGDETPELVIFNADAFGSLFVSYCMQSSPSIWSTIAITSADVVLIGLSIRDILHCRVGLAELEDQIKNGSVWNYCHETMGYKLLGGRKPTTLERAGIILELWDTKDAKATTLRTAQVLPLDPSQQRPRPSACDLARIESSGAAKTSSRVVALFSYIACTSTAWMGGSSIFPEEADHTQTQRQSSSVEISKTYMHKVRRLLYMTEFLLLLKYIEVVIP